MKTSWNLDLIIDKQTQKDPSKLRETVEKETKKFINKWKKNKDFLTDPKVLKQALDEYEIWNRSIGDYGFETYYYWLASSKCQTDEKISAKFNLIHSKAVSLYNEIQFFELEIAKIDKKTQKKILSSKELKDYRHFLKRLFAIAKYTLSDSEEKIMNLKSKTSSSNWKKMLSTLLSKEEREVLGEDGKKKTTNFTEITSLLNSPKKKIRDKASIAFNDILKSYSDVAEHEFNSILESSKVNREIRNYSTPDESRSIGDDLSLEIMHTLKNVVTEKFKIAKDFYKLKAQLLGVEKLEYHERNVPIGEVNEKFEYEKAYQLVLGTFKELEDSFAQVFEDFHKNGQVDVYPAKGKRDGAFCAYALKDAPVFVFLNHTGKLNDVLTLAHEFGHAIHFVMGKKQHALDCNYPMATAETASTFMEDFVLKKLEKGVSDKKKLSLLMMKLNDDVSTIFRQIASYNFELEIHNLFAEIGYLGNKQIGELFKKHMNAYMGAAVKQSEGSENWWIYWSHLRNNFYNYSYAFGLLVSKILQSKVKEDKSYVKEVVKFFEAAGSKSPVEILGSIGVDVTKKETWTIGLNLVNSELTEAKRLARKLGHTSASSV